MVTDKQMKKLEMLAEPLVDFLNKNFNSHTEIRITNTSVEITTAECNIPMKQHLLIKKKE